ncbi:uncharacterized protein LOC116264905 isoform X2 [Nymphaea colorata]|uniref:uncharacterized protein LOC116264905 isoform X2 n=1 Tax=Nymphaea colorata TaxID=210225 RepID=UPI00129E3E6D|nr:uncharacterized protein LOC116264905 isoform X2 [Nymphaea colorata]
MLGAPVAGGLVLYVKKQMWCPVASSLRFNKPLSMVACLSSSSSSSTTTITSASPLQEAAASIPAIPKVILKKGKTQLFRNGSPMVYSRAIDRIVGRPPPKTGDMVLVTDGSEKPIGWGLYNSVSMFSVRIMQLEDDARRDPSCVFNMERLLDSRLEAAVNLRKYLGLPSEDTNAFRLVNSEGDRHFLCRLSGLVVDVFNDCAVVASSAAWVEKYRPTIELLLGKVNTINHTCWRPSVDILKEEGLDLEANNHELSIPDDRVKVKENGIYYTVSLDGQKTGFYADQRESRSLVTKISKNHRVLDLCCYSGGFALNAASGGAAAVVGVDSSSAAIELAKENIFLNSLDHDRISFLKEDAAEFMKSAASKKDSWDLVILDPPKLAPNRKVLQRASGMYRSLNCLAMRVTREGGLLMTCSCSGAMTQSGTFLQVLQGAASMAGRRITVLKKAGAAADHISLTICFEFCKGYVCST